MTTPASSSSTRSSTRSLFRRTTKSGDKRRSRKVRFWFSSSARDGDDSDGDSLLADATAAAQEVDAEAKQTAATGAYAPRVEYGSPRGGSHERDAPWVSDAQVEAHYAEIGWAIARISKDGNCLFRAISDQLYGTEIYHRDIRSRLVDFIERKQQLFRPFVDDEEVSDYCTRMREDGEWGGHPELYAAAKLFNIHLVVHTGPVRRLRMENGADEDGAKQVPPPPPPYRILHLLFKDDHYSSLHPNHESLPTYAATEADDKRARSPTETTTSPQKKFQKFHNLQDAPVLSCECDEVPFHGTVLPRRVVFRRGRRRQSGATLFSLVREPSCANLIATPESPPPSNLSSSSEESTRSDTKPRAATVRVVPVVFPTRTRFHKGRPVAACC